MLNKLSKLQIAISKKKSKDLSKKKCKDTSIQVNLMMIRAASTNLKG
jgi:hypothetical protein